MLIMITELRSIKKKKKGSHSAKKGRKSSSWVLQESELCISFELFRIVHRNDLHLTKLLESKIFIHVYKFNDTCKAVHSRKDKHPLWADVQQGAQAEAESARLEPLFK